MFESNLSEWGACHRGRGASSLPGGEGGGDLALYFPLAKSFRESSLFFLKTEVNLASLRIGQAITSQFYHAGFFQLSCVLFYLSLPN